MYHDIYYTLICFVKNSSPLMCFHPSYDRWRLVNDVGIPSWSLSIKKKRTNKCTNVVKKATIVWWAFETRINLNKFDVTRKCLDVGVYDEKPTHLLMEI
jgi:hypothetical protein